MNKKKILVLAMTLSMVAILAIGGTIAYFTDTDSADNTFTVGGVKIELVEQQRNDDASALEKFENGKVLMPIVGSAQGEKEEVGGVTDLPTAENYVDKIITVKNTGKSEAYMRVFLAIPVVLDNVGDASQNILHFNWNPASSAEGEWTKEVCTAKDVEIDGLKYNVYSRIYTSPVVANESTKTPAYIGFYLDKNVDYDAVNNYYTINGKQIAFDFEKGVTIPVYAQGIQTAGFANAEEAFTKADLTVNPWQE